MKDTKLSFALACNPSSVYFENRLKLAQALMLTSQVLAEGAEVTRDLVRDYEARLTACSNLLAEVSLRLLRLDDDSDSRSCSRSDVKEKLSNLRTWLSEERHRLFVVKP